MDAEGRDELVNVLESRSLFGKSNDEIHIESKQVPKIFDATQVVRLDVAILVTHGSWFLVIEPQLDLFEDGVAELFEKMNIRNRSPRAPEGYG